MLESAKEIVPVSIEDELKQSYLDYAMSVIVGRALPDVRDGLKPVHRRALFAMEELGNDWNKPYKKSARVVGDVIGKYHPHGDTAVYDTIVRMAQPFSMRYCLVDGQGNFGSIDGDSPAAMRYTEVRMSKIAHELLADLDKETVDFVPNYDETEFAPSVLPAKIPNLLVNGSSGIAVGMATNIPPHNLTEVVNACILCVDNPEATLEEVMTFVPGPDFPTAGIINGRAGIAAAYRTGRGRVLVRARTEIETFDNNREAIIVNELPYQVNKARLIEKIAELVKDKKIEGITGLRDESDKDGMRIVIELRRGEMSEVVLNNLFIHTQMQNTYGINMVALVDGQPRTLGIMEIIHEFIRHRREVVTRRTIYELAKARSRGHILEGLGIALANIDEIIALIKAAANPQAAKDTLTSRAWKLGAVEAMLMRADPSASRPLDLPEHFGISSEGYRLSPEQAQAILDLRLHRLTALEQDKILAEYEELLVKIKELMEILADPKRLMAVIREELVAVREEFGDERRTEIRETHEDLTAEDLINEEDVVVTLSNEGYVKYQPVSAYQAQHRGGRGKSATAVKDEDFIQRLIIASTHDTMLCFSNKGKVYWLKVYQLPVASRASRGRPIVNLLPLSDDERINAILPIRNMDTHEHFVVMATAQGVIKKTGLGQFSRPRSNGIIALELLEGDQVVGVSLTNGDDDIMLFTDAGKAIRFHEKTVREMGRTARGVRGVKLQEGQKVIALNIAEKDGSILTATENGYGKRTASEEYRITGRGGQGVISIQVTERNGKVVKAIPVKDNDELMLITDGGTLVRMPASEISVIGRNTQGVKLINLTNGEKLVGMQRIMEEIGAELESGSESETDES